MKVKLLLLICMFSSQLHAGPSIWDLDQTPTSEVLNGISAPNNYFAIAVGENGAIVHFKNGDNGTLIPSGTTNELYDVYAASDQLAVAAGVEIVLLWNGTDWQQIASNMNSNYTGLWITPEKDFLFYQDFGSPFSFICPYEIGAVQQGFCLGQFEAMLTMCGQSDDIKMVMDNGDIRHYKNSLAPFNGIDELLHDESKFLNLTGVFIPESACLPGPFKPLDIYAINNTKEFYHFDGNQWNNMGVIIPNDQTLTWLNGSRSNNIVATGFKPNGMLGNDGVIWTFDGSIWTEETNLPIGTPGLTDVAVNIGLIDEIFIDGFEVSNMALTNSDIKVDILAAAENGHKISSDDIFETLFNDVTVDKKLITPEPIHSGDTIIFQIDISNSGPSNAIAVKFYDSYEHSIELTQDNCNMQTSEVKDSFTRRTKNIPIVSVDEMITCTMEFKVIGNVGDMIINYANIRGMDSNSIDIDMANDESYSRAVIQPN